MSEGKSIVPFLASSPDSEVAAKPQRRKFSAEDKKRILEETDRAVGHGVAWAPSCGEKASTPRRYTAGVRSAIAPYAKLSLRNVVRSRSAIRWPPKTRSYAGTINVCRRT